MIHILFFDKETARLSKYKWQIYFTKAPSCVPVGHSFNGNFSVPIMDYIFRAMGFAISYSCEGGMNYRPKKTYGKEGIVSKLLTRCFTSRAYVIKNMAAGEKKKYSIA